MFVTDPSWAIGEWKKREFIEPQFELIEQLASEPNAPLGAYRAVHFFRPEVIAKGKGISTKRPLPSHKFTTWCEAFEQACCEYAAALKAAFIDWATVDIAVRKERLGVVAFGDLLSIFHDALHGAAGERLVEAIRTRFEAALVDEFQDTDPIQAGIFQRLFGEVPQRLFYIGDPKQAIYGFRGADVFTYLRVSQTAARTFHLDTNHRSDAKLVAAVNTLFGRGASPFIEKRIPFHPVFAAKPPEKRPLKINGEARAPMRFWFWESDKDITAKDALSDLPHVVASEIVRMLKVSRLEDRALLPRDCAILCGTNGQCQEMQAALSERGVPSVVLSNANVFASDEARELHLVMHAISAPSREPAIRAALATRIFGHDAESLESLAADSAGWEQLLARFQRYHVRWRDAGFFPMFREVIQQEHIRTRVLGQPQGDRRLTNLLHLSELLHTTAEEFQLSPGGLLRWFAEQLKDPGSGDERELRLERDDDAVKILTVHKSKGLEWPIVFCPFLWTKADLREAQNPIFHDKEDRAVIDLGSPDYDVARQKAEHENLAERMRLLYVALTRARHECHVVWGRFKDSENSAMMWLMEPPAEFGNDAPAALRAHAASRTSKMLCASTMELASATPDQFSAAMLPEISNELFAPQSTVGNVGAARVFTGDIDRTWRVSSFTGYTAQRDSEEADRDRENRPVFSELRKGIHAFPGGMKAGVCIHDIMEHLDFTRSSGIHALVESKLKLHGLYSVDHTLALVQTIRKMLEVPLIMTPASPAASGKAKKRSDELLELPFEQGGGGLKLGSIRMEKTLRELEFHLPSGLISAVELSAFTAAGLTFEPRRGVLKGFMDLVFEHEGRFHILDWKSNTLGATSAAYTPAAMWGEIAHHRYDLQWKLYLLALHRFLRLRLKADYDPSRHLGTVFYVFIRGVEPFQPELGIHRAEPDIAELERLDALFSAK
jgi:exodeoxyribonuclease V beta subunit